MGTLKFSDGNIASPQRLAADIEVTQISNLNDTTDAQAAALQQAQIDALYQAGLAMAAMSDILEQNLI